MSVLAVAAETTNQLITLAAALGGAIIGGALALVGTERQNRHATAERKAVASAARRERAAAVLGRVQRRSLPTRRLSASESTSTPSARRKS
jgi:hypothetical protein